MCGILAVLGLKSAEAFSVGGRRLIQKLQHRGPDRTSFKVFGDTFIGFTRLAVVGVENGDQPFESENGKTVCVVNGEIFNDPTLREKYSDVEYATKSDCESVLKMYEKFGADLYNHIEGQFAFFIRNENECVIGRDPFGIVSLYYGHDVDNNMWVSSELRLLVGNCTRISAFPPGTVYSSTKGWMKNHTFDSKPTLTPEFVKIRSLFTKAVEKRLRSDIPVGVLLSGGIDSSLVASISKSHIPKIQTFSIGLKGSDDHVHAKQVADFLQTEHHAVEFTIEEGLSTLKSAIESVESFDVPLVRTAVPMFLLFKYIKQQTHTRVLLTGDGADEIFGGYASFKLAQTPEKLHEACIERLEKIHGLDCLRTDKCSMAWSCEARVPFLDKDFSGYVMGLNPSFKMHHEKGAKHLLREAFSGTEVLPQQIIWRPKQQLSDGIGESWLKELALYAENQVTEEEMSSRQQTFPTTTPATKEGYLYRKIFQSLFPGAEGAVTVWRPVKSIGQKCNDPTLVGKYPEFYLN